ncbi:TetR/AcrR family transcriptional regulator [Amycolatopsis acidiphila]|uniref:TetR/AcrR family transcriptional regulator n=1 Tax=Amycolatopsis acidiphila TaxID=715473 RepID=A0A558ACC4_9PSEU|nr:TetR/AcrR family transcriptional regulator [Amycolatopsis acidiphila]TVT21920.1 TetR/AcrR family transcriptional regulator [Amycolatopsis acidiphila]UIJ57342.1 TetR/AcrR family transcriptional regulator [Amycolatopsis acidiphila]GHG84702.1 hypothetical protein GCM10017788_57030 [Amycolatopsis acidiphila]
MSPANRDSPGGSGRAARAGDPAPCSPLTAKGSFFHHFGDRAGFLLAIHHDFHERPFAEIRDAIDGMRPGREHLIRGTSAYLDGCLRHRGVRALLLEARGTAHRRSGHRFVASVPEGQFDDERRQAIVKDVTAAVLDAENGAYPYDPQRVRVLPAAVPERPSSTPPAVLSPAAGGVARRRSEVDGRGADQWVSLRAGSRVSCRITVASALVAVNSVPGC